VTDLPAGYILIIADIDGYNDSVAQFEENTSAPWPVIRANLGERVGIMPHQSFKISFVADEVGTFRIYCAIFCPVHPYMQNGELIVTS
jgi:hypothetical protein